MQSLGAHRVTKYFSTNQFYLVTNLLDLETASNLPAVTMGKCTAGRTPLPDTSSRVEHRISGKVSERPAAQCSTSLQHAKVVQEHHLCVW